MPKGYTIVRIDITDPDAYARYAKVATEAIRKHGGRVLARGGRIEAVEGAARARNVIVEFDSFEAARTFYFSSDYQQAKALREGAATVEYVLVEGA
jgi:uncharacterized protein (DUF1330 family)